MVHFLVHVTLQRVDDTLIQDKILRVIVVWSEWLLSEWGALFRNEYSDSREIHVVLHSAQTQSWHIDRVTLTERRTT